MGSFVDTIASWTRRGLGIPIVISMVFWILSSPGPVQADICWPSRSMSQWRCIPGIIAICDTTCSSSGCYYSGCSGCSQSCGAYGSDPDKAYDNCVSECEGVYGGTCAAASCLKYTSGTDPECKLEADRLVPCTTSPCQTTVAPVDCVWSGGTCTEAPGSPMGCWGPGPTPTPGGPTPTPGGPTPTPGGPTPTPPPPLCPNGACDIAETCSTCPDDCGVCLVNKGTVQARARKISTGDSSCAAVYASTTPVTPTTLSANGATVLSPQTQTDGNYVSWPNISAGTYTIAGNPPSGYVLQAACWQRTSTAPLSGTGMSSSFAATGETLSWDLGYSLGVSWTQALGGDVYASATMQSYVPVGTTPRAFILNGTGGYPGIATYGQSYNFDGSGATRGQTWVSSKNWLVKDTSPDTDFYQLMYRQFGGAPVTVDYINPISPITQPPYKPDSNNPDIYIPYYVTGNMTTSGNWSVGDGKKLIFIVNGDLTINGKINTVGNGFVAFIVNGDITVDPSVGVAYTSGVPVVEGIYITAPSKSFITNTGSAPSTARFVGKGMFIAGSFLLQRDLGDAGNPTTSSELFIYNPQLLLTMPEAMKRLSVSWQEVAP